MATTLSAGSFVGLKSAVGDMAVSVELTRERSDKPSQAPSCETTAQAQAALNPAGCRASTQFDTTLYDSERGSGGNTSSRTALTGFIEEPALKGEEAAGDELVLLEDCLLEEMATDGDSNGDGIDVNLTSVADIPDFDLACAYLDATTAAELRGGQLPMVSVPPAQPPCPPLKAPPPINTTPNYAPMQMPPPPSIPSPAPMGSYGLMVPPMACARYPSNPPGGPLPNTAGGMLSIRSNSVDSTCSQSSLGSVGATTLAASSSCGGGFTEGSVTGSMGGSDRGGQARRKRNEPRTKTVEQLEKIRERNRILARRTRLRKKMVYESLQKQVNDLKRENAMLKSKAGRSTSRGPGDTASERDELETMLGSASTMGDDDFGMGLSLSDSSVRRLLRSAQHTFCITDPSQPTKPLVYASPSFVRITGYQPEQMFGRDLRFLSGPFTDAMAAEAMFRAVDEGTETAQCMQIRRADSTPLWAQLYVSPLRNRSGKTVQTIVAVCPLDGPPMDDDEMDDLDDTFDEF